MNRQTWLLALAAIYVFGHPAVATAAVEVKPDKENVVASRLAGAWEPDPVLTARLGGRGLGPVAVRVDAKAVAELPEKFAALFRERPAYLAGVMTLRRQEFPFVLTENRGNPHLIFFRPRGDEPLGDAESLNVMLAPAADPAGDLLFIGGDFNNQPFSAYRRAGAGEREAGKGAEAGGEPGNVIPGKLKVILDAGTQADADAAVETVTRFLKLW